MEPDIIGANIWFDFLETLPDFNWHKLTQAIQSRFNKMYYCYVDEKLMK